MSYVNENFLELQQNYLFSTIAKKVEAFTKAHPEKKVIRLGIGDVTLPLPNVVIEAMQKAIKEMQHKDTFRGYGPEQGYDFLREKIVENDFKGMDISPDEIFISDGSKCDCGNIVDIFAKENKIAITDPVYPVYLDSNVMAGRAGKWQAENGTYANIVYLPVTEENQFKPAIPKEKVDIIYLCFPNNPTGTILTKQELQTWVEYAKENKAILVFDAAYEAFITQPDIPHSIYEIPGAKEVAMECRSYSKTAGFTGVRCAYTVVPKELKGYTKEKTPVSLNALWNRRQCTKFNGVSYIVQRGAEALYTEQGKAEIQERIQYYLRNSSYIYQQLKNRGYTVFGGMNSPYVWWKVPEGYTSWGFFDTLLEKANVVGTPGCGFGPHGEGYFRLTGFGTEEDTKEAIERIQTKLKT